MKNRLLLINPPIYDFAAYNLWSRPLGLLYIASFLKKLGFNVDYIDCLSLEYEGTELKNNPKLIGSKQRKYSTYQHYKEETKKSEIYKSIKRNYYRFGIGKKTFFELLHNLENPDAILVTSIMTYWYIGVFDVIKWLKEIYPGIPVILGGIYATLCYEHALKNSGADYVLSGGNLEELLKLTNKILKTNEIQKKYESQFENNNPLPVLSPALDFYKKNDFIPLLTSIGCKFKCKYCASHYLCPQFTERYYSDIINEIAYWKNRYNIKDIAFYDDAFLFNKEKRLIPLLNEVIKRKIKVNFHTPNGLHVKFIDKNTALLMKNAGFKTLRFGLESSIKKFQKDSCNKVSNKDFDKTMRIINNAGFTKDEIGIYILIGLPYQTPDDVIETIKLVKSHGVNPKLCEFSPIPHTLYFKESQKSSNKDLNEPLYQNNTTLELWSKEFSGNVINELKDMARS